MKTVTLLKDIKPIGYHTLEKGTKLELIIKSKCFAYLKINGCTIRVSLKDIE